MFRPFKPTFICNCSLASVVTFQRSRNWFPLFCLYNSLQKLPILACEHPLLEGDWLDFLAEPGGDGPAHVG